VKNHHIGLRKNIKLSPETFRELRDFIYEKSGIFFSEGKLYLLEGRLNRRIQKLELESFEEYVAYLKRGMNQKEELTMIFNLVTINETYFFRFERQLKVFSEKLFPVMVKTRREQGRQKIRIWSAGCSTGEEVYTLAIMIRENMNGSLGGMKIDLLGTDISHNVLEKAKKGLFTKNSFRGSMPSHYKAKYFVNNSTHAEIKDDLKRNVEFQYLNLKDVHKIRLIGSVDFIFCRNVLIYFDEMMKKRVIRSFYDTLNHGGYLFLGEAESLHGISSAFKVEHFPGTFLYKKE